MHHTVYLARHGETDWNRLGRWQGHTDIALSAAGRDQARQLADRLANRGITRVHASDLVRARETAEIVAACLGLGEVHVDSGLRERGFGCFEGLTRDECAIAHPEAWLRYREDCRQMPTGAEPHEQVIQRMSEALRRATNGEGQAVPLLVSHGASIRALIGATTGTTVPPLPNTALLRVHVVDGVMADAEQLP